MAEKERMELANMFQYVMDHYEEVGPRVDSSTKVYKTLCKDIPAYLSNLIGMNDIYVVKGRMGSANKSECPWVAIMDRNITQSTQKGLYVVFLFAKDMKSFYLTLNQGITNFENLFGKYKYDNAEKVPPRYMIPSRLLNAYLHSHCIVPHSRHLQAGYLHGVDS